MEEGCQQVLWTNGDYLTECGNMNLFVYWRTPAGEKELITHPLDGTIMPGMTRNSLLALSRMWGEFHVSERRFTIQELINAM